MESSPRVYEWTAPLPPSGGDGSASFLLFPWDLKAEFGKANLVPVQVDFEGVPYRGSLANMGSGPCLVVTKAVRAQLGKAPGDPLRVRLWHDTEPRIVEAPADLAEALAAVPEAQARWDRFSPSHKKEYVRWIEEAKKPETRARRVAEAVPLVLEGRKLK